MMLDRGNRKTLIWANVIMLATIIIHDIDHVRQAICWNYRIPLYLYIVNISAYLPSYIALVLAFKKKKSSTIATAVNGCGIAAGFAQIHLWKPLIPIWGIWNKNFFLLGADAISWTILAITIIVGVGVAMTGAYVRGRCLAQQANTDNPTSQPSDEAISPAAKLLLGILLVTGSIWIAKREISYGGDFTLSHNGKPWTYSQSSKTLNILYFGYAKCGDVCPVTLTRASEAFRQLNDSELQCVQLIFVSVDHDNPEEVSTYAARFFPQFIGLNGSKEQIDTAIHLLPAGYFVEKNPPSSTGYTITHTDKLFFMDPSGRMVDSLASPRDSSEILGKIRALNPTI